jgi:hypothetical protein
MSGHNKWEDTRGKSELTPEQLLENTRVAEAIALQDELCAQITEGIRAEIARRKALMDE